MFSHLTQVAMATLIFQSHQCFSVDESSEKLQSEVEELILEETSKMNLSSRYWVMYRIARQATRQVWQKICYFYFEVYSLLAIPV